VGSTNGNPHRHIALVGPTAAGKSALAVDLAQRRGDAELVSVDSMGVYRHMDIGTAKPNPRERARVRYHLLDLVEPREEFTLRQFQEAARQALGDIETRGHRALLVGGTALYLRAVVDDLEVPGKWTDLAHALEAEAHEPGGARRLYRRLEGLDPVAAARMLPGNTRRVVRALEVTVGSGRRFSSFGPGLDCYGPTNFVLVGIRFDASVYDARIEERFRAMLDQGLLEEVRALRSRTGGMSRTARQALGYRELLAHLEDGVPLDEAVAEAVRRTKAFARRQWRWFRRDPRVTWLDPGRDYSVQLAELWDATSEATVFGGTRN
jgi:tRNA dimethylallyltransferase